MTPRSILLALGLAAAGCAAGPLEAGTAAVTSQPLPPPPDGAGVQLVLEAPVGAVPERCALVRLPDDRSDLRVGGIEHRLSWSASAVTLARAIAPDVAAGLVSCEQVAPQTDAVLYSSEAEAGGRSWAEPLAFAPGEPLTVQAIFGEPAPDEPIGGVRINLWYALP